MTDLKTYERMAKECMEMQSTLPVPLQPVMMKIAEAWLSLAEQSRSAQHGKLVMQPIGPLKSLPKPRRKPGER